MTEPDWERDVIASARQKLTAYCDATVRRPRAEVAGLRVRLTVVSGQMLSDDGKATIHELAERFIAGDLGAILVPVVFLRQPGLGRSGHDVTVAAAAEV